MDMPDRTKNPKKNNRENKKNDIGRPQDTGKDPRKPPVFENHNGMPIE